MLKHLYLMRHGQTLFNVQHKIQGWCDSPLTKEGIAQAQAAKACLKGVSFDHYYCSTAERASDTLEIVIDPETPYTRLKGLKERYFAVFEGQDEALNPPFEKYDEVFSIYGGETRSDVQERMVNTLKKVMDQDDHFCILAVSHAGACMSFFSAFADPDIIQRSGGVTNCAIFHYTYDGRTFHFQEIIRPC